MIIETYLLALSALHAGGELPVSAGRGTQQHLETPAATGTPRSGLPENNLHYEAIIIHTDRDIYIAGERLYFRLDLSGSGAVPSSSLAYVALRDSENQTIVTLCTDVIGTIGHGTIYIPDTLASAPYQLVAFTNQMRNHGDEYYGTKQLLVANRFDDGPVAGAELLKVGGRDGDGADRLTGGPAGAELLKVGGRDGDGADRMTGAPAGGTLLATTYKDDEIAGRPDGDHVAVKINLPSREFGTREKIRFTVESRNPGDSLLSFSVSVVQKESLFKSFREELFFRRPFSSLPEKPNSFFREINGQVISGKVICRISGEPVEGATVLLNTPDSVLNLLYARSLPEGEFHFLLDNYHHGRDLYLSLYDSEKPADGRIRMDEKFYFRSPFRPSPMVVAEGFDSFLGASRDIVTVNRVFGTDHNLYKETERNVHPPRIYGRPSVYFNLFDEYVHFNDIHEIARELIPVLRIRRQRDGGYRSTLLLNHDEYIMIETPVYFLDGLFVDDVNKILHLDSRILGKMEIQNHIWQHGNIRFTGIVAFFSNNNEFRNIRPASTTISFHQPAIASKASYNQPAYDISDPGNRAVPDFRQLLFWEPDRTGNSTEIEFYSGDIKGEFVILVRGMVSGEQIINERAEITIR
jgi:hypothetical protein